MGKGANTGPAHLCFYTMLKACRNLLHLGDDTFKELCQTCSGLRKITERLKEMGFQHHPGARAIVAACGKKREVHRKPRKHS